MRAFSVAAVTFLVLALAGRTQFYPLVVLKGLAYDLGMSCRVALLKPEPPRVSVVTITETTLKTLPDGFRKHPRLYYAKLLETLTKLDARAVAFDLVFDAPDPEADRQLAQAMLQQRHVVLAAADDPAQKPIYQAQEVHNLIFPVPDLRKEAAYVGAARIEQDPDLALRRVRWWLPAMDEDANDIDLPTLGVAAAAAAGESGTGPEIVARVRKQRRFLGHPVRWTPVAGSMESYICYFGPEGEPDGPHSLLAFEDVITAADNPGALEMLRPLIQGRVILIGNASRLGQDFHRSPVIAGLRDLGAPGQMSGVEIQAQIVQSFLRGDYPIVPSGAALALLFVTCFGAAVLGRKVSPLLIVLIGGLLSLAMWAACVAMFVQRLVWVDPSVPSLAGIAVAGETMRLMYFAEGRERARVLRHLSRHVGPGVAASLAREALPELGGETRVITVLFSDFSGFTGISESMTSREICTLLNRYWGVVLPVLDRNGGCVAQLMGDGMMAYFGWPQQHSDHAARAVRFALETAEAMQAWLQTPENAGFPPLRTRFGIHTGEATIGEIGCGSRVEFTAIGNVTNVASRLESMNKEFGSAILISEATREAAGLELPLVDRGLIPVRGRSEPLKVYSIECGPMF